MKNDIRIFSQLYIATQTRDGDLDTFFSHENSAVPPALACNGKIRSGVKSDLLGCLKYPPTVELNINQPGLSETENESSITAPNRLNGKILEGSVLVNMLKPPKGSTFGEYARTLFLPKVAKELQSVSRIDIVFDCYKKNSLKETARQRRGTGIRRKVEELSQTPSNWHSFLRIDKNKTELFSFLSEQMTSNPELNKLVIAAFEDVVLTSNQADVRNLSPCNHEEADTRVFLHALDMSNNGLQNVMIKTVDTDVVVLAVSMYAELNLKELWIEFCSGQNQVYYPIHILYNSLGPSKSRGLLFFHSLTGTDQTSYFANCRKKSAWTTWCNFDEVTETFIKLSFTPSLEDVKDAMPVLERFVVLMYDKTSNCLDVNNCRRNLFVKKGRAMDALPPTSAALLQHSFRAAYQAGHVWRQSLIAQQQLPPPENWGWKKAGESYIPHWTDLGEAAIALRELTKCSCNPEKGCSGRCKCAKAELTCTELCKCNGDCERD